MSRVVYSQANPPVTTGEFFTEPSLTDQLADEPLDRIVKRFVSQGFVPMSHDKPDVVIGNDVTGEQLDEAFDDFSSAEVRQMDKVEMVDALVTAQTAFEQLQKAKFKKPVQTPKSSQQESQAPDVIDGAETQQIA